MPENTRSSELDEEITDILHFGIDYLRINEKDIKGYSAKKSEARSRIKALIASKVEEARIEENLSMKESVTHGYSMNDWCHNHDKHVSQCYACRESKWGNIFCKKFEEIIDERLKALQSKEGDS